MKEYDWESAIYVWAHTRYGGTSGFFNDPRASEIIARAKELMPVPDNILRAIRALKEAADDVEMEEIL